MQVVEQPRNLNVPERKLPYICSLPGAKVDQPNVSVVPESGSSILRDQPNSDEEEHSQKHQENGKGLQIGKPQSQCAGNKPM